MNGRVFKTQARRSRVKISKALLATLLDTPSGKRTGIQSSTMSLIVSRRAWSLLVGAQNFRGATKRSLL